MQITKLRIKGYRKFRDMEFRPHPRSNIIVGANGSGKSTILEALIMVLTGRIGRLRAVDEINPYWFNQANVDEFFNQKSVGASVPMPDFRIDVHLRTRNKQLEAMRGVHNLSEEDSVGMSIRAYPDPAYAQEIENYFSVEGWPRILPVEYYRVDWLDFSGGPIFKTPKGLGVSIIDGQAVFSRNGLDAHTRQLLDQRIDEKAKVGISVEHRKMRSTLGGDVLKGINKQLGREAQEAGSVGVGIQVDQSRSASWDATLIPEIGGIPLGLAGQGAQVTAKTILALNQSHANVSCVLIEEPENHLSHTKLRILLDLVSKNVGDQQLFVTTHSSFVLNRLGLDHLAMLRSGEIRKFDQLSPETVEYFQKLSGFDSLRLLLADLAVVVEGPSDEIVFNRFFKDRFGVEPLDQGIDVVTVGTSFARAFELADRLGIRLAALRDNDGESASHWEEKSTQYLEPGHRQFFIGDKGLGHTLEPQICNANKAEALRELFDLDPGTDVESWMTGNKTTAALKIAESQSKILPPVYFNEAFDFLMSPPGSRSS
ncbi:ATP-dependent nuclease [Corynebacterium alimapuense]|nr:AAA family ATPase [Corynebacterium alimapuense]